MTMDPRVGASFYTVRIAIPESELKAVPSLKPVPGMPVEAFMQGEHRSFLSFLVGPLRDQIWRF